MKGSRWKQSIKINEKVACLIEKVLFWDAQQKVHSERFSKAVLPANFFDSSGKMRTVKYHM